MHSFMTSLTVLATLLVAALASPAERRILGRRSVAAIESSSELQAMSVDDGVSMQWTGSIFEGEAPVTLYGTAQRLYEAIIVVNPGLGSNDTAAETKRGNTSGALTKRDAYTCRVMATGNRVDTTDAEIYLNKLGGNCGAPNNECRRMTCENTTGSYICSEFNDGTSIPCSDASSRIFDINSRCCRAGGSEDATSGYYYPDNRDYSIWAGYANCNHASSKRPSDYPYPGGSPNGQCNL